LPEIKQDDEVVLLARAKLLVGRSTLTDINGPGPLACLSFRFALEFNLADEKARNVVLEQIERHMRLCVVATAGFKTLVTIAGSEPLLAEAARYLLDSTYKSPVHHLANHPDLNCVERGQLGELVAALLIMRARDASSSLSKRSVYVTDFMEALLPSSAYKKLKKARPNHWRTGERRPFERTFKDYKMWFNHVIRTRSYDMINIESLWKFITRGAMVVVCAGKQRGVDIVLPICDPNRTLSRHNVTAILIQVKTDKSFQHDIRQNLFDAMDPFLLGLFSDGDSPLPIIRMVFALGSDQPGIFFPAVTEFRYRGEQFTSYDVWCAGLSPATFKDIDDDLASYRTLLRPFLQPQYMCELREIEGQSSHEMTRASRRCMGKMEPLAEEKVEY
jgi:hypothetical protein